MKGRGRAMVLSWVGNGSGRILERAASSEAPELDFKLNSEPGVKGEVQRWQLTSV